MGSHSDLNEESGGGEITPLIRLSLNVVVAIDAPSLRFLLSVFRFLVTASANLCQLLFSRLVLWPFFMAFPVLFLSLYQQIGKLCNCGIDIIFSSTFKV